MTYSNSDLGMEQRIQVLQPISLHPIHLQTCSPPPRPRHTNNKPPKWTTVGMDLGGWAVEWVKWVEFHNSHNNSFFNSPNPSPFNNPTEVEIIIIMSLELVIVIKVDFYLLYSSFASLFCLNLIFYSVSGSRVICHWSFSLILIRPASLKPVSTLNLLLFVQPLIFYFS